MYPIYFESPASQLSLNDYLQLEKVLHQEQLERELLHRKQQEQARIQRAMYKLQVMTELHRQRQQEELAIQAYYARKREQQLQEQRKQLLIEQQRRLALQRQQQEYYAALQQRQELEEYYERMAAALEQQQQKSVHYAQPCMNVCEAMEQEESESEEEEEEDHRQAQLENLVKLIFGSAEPEEQHAPVKANQAPQQEQQAPQQAHQQEQERTMTLDQFIDYISKKAQSLDEDDEEEEEQETGQDIMEQDETGQDTMEQDENDKDAMEQDIAMLALQHIDDEESEDSMDEDDFEHVEQVGEEQVPALVESTSDIQELVHDVLNSVPEEEHVSPFPKEDPVKIAKYDALSRIQQELEQLQAHQQEHGFEIELDFSEALQHGEDSDSASLTATTPANREFLGFEDQLMKTLLKLDMIESDGDEGIRKERKALVKIAEKMLDSLDDFKQKEWERVSCGSHSTDEEM